MEDYLYIKNNFDSLLDSISRISERVGVKPPFLLPVTKSGSDEELAALFSLGVTDFGENRPQELKRRTELLREKGFSVYPSDQKNFPLGVGICALRKGAVGLYMGRIHTRRDTILEQTNVNILRSALTSLITCAANKKG